MSRNARVVVPEVPHHVTQRGIRKSDIFIEEADYRKYTDLIIENSRKYGVVIRSYSWMPNHVHLIAIPLHPDSFAKTFRRCHSAYARWFNRKYGLSGYLWEDRYFSCPLDEAHFWASMRYVERNPVRAGLVSKAEDYPWSSAAFHSFGKPNLVVDPTWDPRDVIANWAQWLAIPNDPSYDKAIREKTRKGFPCGDECFVSVMEEQLGRILRVQRRGPKPRMPKNSGIQFELL